MALITFTGDDSITISAGSFGQQIASNDMGKGDYFKVDFDTDMGGGFASKSGNANFYRIADGILNTAEMRIMRASATDIYLNGLQTNQLQNGAFPITIDAIRFFFDDTYRKIEERYQFSGIIKKIPSVVYSSSGNEDQAQTIWSFSMVPVSNSVRTIS